MDFINQLSKEDVESFPTLVGGTGDILNESMGIYIDILNNLLADGFGEGDESNPHEVVAELINQMSNLRTNFSSVASYLDRELRRLNEDVIDREEELIRTVLEE